jgi:vacuolar iron transporter family protein
MVLIPGPSRAPVTFVIVVLALALTGWISARISGVRSARPIVRMAGVGIVAMVITYVAGLVLYP